MEDDKKKYDNIPTFLDTMYQEQGMQLRQKLYRFIEILGVLKANSSRTNNVPIEHGPPMVEGRTEQGKTEYTLATEKNNHDASEGALCLLHLSASARPGDATIPSGITSTVKSTPKTRSDSFSSNQSARRPVTRSDKTSNQNRTPPTRNSLRLNKDSYVGRDICTQESPVSTMRLIENHRKVATINELTQESEVTRRIAAPVSKSAQRIIRNTQSKRKQNRAAPVTVQRNDLNTRSKRKQNLKPSNDYTY